MTISLIRDGYLKLRECLSMSSSLSHSIKQLTAQALPALNTASTLKCVLYPQLTPSFNANVYAKH